MKNSSIKKTLLVSTMAFALSAGMAMPAFAVTPTGVGDEGALIASDGSAIAGGSQVTDQEYVAEGTATEAAGKTEVGVFSRMGQLKISVPTKIALALTAGGGTISGPDARTSGSTSSNPSSETPTTRMGSGYGIENLGGMDVKVSKIDAATENTFTLVQTAQTATSTTTTGKYANLYLNMAVSGAKGSANNITGGLKQTQQTNWVIPGATSDTSGNVTPSVLGIAITGSNSPLKGQVGKVALNATKALDLTYTVGIA